MKKKLYVLVLLVFFAFPSFVYSAQPLISKNDVNRQTFFNKITDYFATAGKSEQEKNLIISERKQWRKKSRLREKRIKKEAQIRKRMKKQNKNIMDKMKAQNNAKFAD